MTLENIYTFSQTLKNNIEKVIIGKSPEIDKILIALLCEGHILLEDIPGTGKTTLAKALSKSISCTFKRIQFTPDLLPSDLTGINFYNQKEEEFIFKEGPIFTNILLADEINRATPRTQSSLLECMEEAQITVDGNTFILEKPFLVIATQNPIETQGTFPLPEAQLDRFFMRLSMGYPSKANELAILDCFESTNPLHNLESVITKEQLVAAQKLTSEVTVTTDIKEYVVNLADATRCHPMIKLGVSIRGSLALLKAAKARALIQNRDYVLPDDVKAICKDIFAHRIICKGYTLNSSITTTYTILDEILNKVPVPIE